MLSRKSLYALRALISLTQAYPAALTSLEIVNRDALPRKFLEAILLDLKRSGITVSARGRDGGHCLSRAPQAISLAEIVRVTNGPLAMMPCASVTRYEPCEDCVDVATCRIRLAFAKGRDALAATFEGISLADLADPGLAETLRTIG